MLIVFLSSSCQQSESGGAKPPDSYVEARSKNHFDSSKEPTLGPAQESTREPTQDANEEPTQEPLQEANQEANQEPGHDLNRESDPQLQLTKQEKVLLDGFSSSFVNSAQMEAIGCWFKHDDTENVYQFFAGYGGALVSITGRPVRLQKLKSATVLDYGAFDAYANSAENLHIKINLIENKTRTSGESFAVKATIDLTVRDKHQIIEGLIHCGV